MSRAQLGEQRRFLGCSSSCFWCPVPRMAARCVRGSRRQGSPASTTSARAAAREQARAPAGEEHWPREITSLPQGAAAPTRGGPLEAVLALQLLEGDATGGLVPSPRAVDQVNEVRAMAQGEGLEVQTATDRHHGRHGLPTTCEYPGLLGSLPAVLRERGFRDLHCLHGLMSFPPIVIRSRTLIPTATMITTGSGFSSTA